MTRETDTNEEDAGPLLPSLLDRLCQSDGSPGSRGGIAHDLKAGIRRDLENMLNTRWRCIGFPPDLKELEMSLVNYGLPDCTAGTSAAGNGREEFRRIIERAIQKYEPRFRSVRVKLVTNSESSDRTFRFRIDAVLHGTAEPVVFDTALETSTATFQVRRPVR
jgi:type VI secretion system protein ImpF